MMRYCEEFMRVLAFELMIPDWEHSQEKMVFSDTSDVLMSFDKKPRRWREFS